MQEVARISPLGLYAGTMLKYDIDMGRIETVAERIARGLFYYHIDRPIPQECLVKAMCMTGRTIERDLQENIRGFAHALSKAETYNIGDGVFRYRFSHVEERESAPNSTVWLFSVYEAIEFVTLVVDSFIGGAPRRI
ncbi:hypothetical protein ACFLSF_00040 [Candidatus Bipolaricaulota bacterium]